MSRRLKHRLPAAIRASKTLLPQFAILVSATIVITPKAFAQLVGQKAEPLFVISSEKAADASIWTKTYSKEELQQTTPVNPVETIEARIGSEISGLFKKLTSNQKKAADWEKLQTEQPDKDAYNMRIATLKDDTAQTRAANAEGVRLRLGSETQKTLTQRIKSSLTFFNRVTSGVGFDLDVKKMFSSDDETKKASKKNGTVRYGLVLQDIVPAEAPDRASLYDGAEELRYAGHADVKWTIGPIDEEQGRRLFELHERARETEEAAAKTDSFWSRIRIPKLAFKGKAAPEGFDNMAAVDAKALPNWRVDFAQTEDFYNLTYRTTTAGKELSAEHQVRIPIAGTIAVGRRFDDKFKVVETSAYNILYDQRLPLVSLHHMEVEQRYKADVTYRKGVNAVTVGAQGRAQGVLDKKKEKERPERYTLEYGRDL